MATLIGIGLVLLLLAFMLYSCTFNNHKWVVVELDDKYDCHKIECMSCGKKATIDPYAGLGG